VRVSGAHRRPPGSPHVFFFLKEDAMHANFRSRGAALAGLFALALAAVAPSVASAKPSPGAQPRRGFRLFARPLGAMTINRIYCGLSSTGEVCVDSSGSSTIGGGFWPKGTGDQYIFNSGLQIAGKVGPDGGPWAGDITGAFLFDPKGTTQHGEQVQPIYNSSNPADAAAWPAAAMVPQGDANETIFNPVLRGRVAASQGDVWWLTWDGNPAQNAGRPHPMGIMVEQRGLGFNYPTGNEDILYFVYTFYNVTSSDPAAYAAIRPGMREIAQAQGAKFHQLNPAAPANGFTLTNLFAAFAADMDVASAGVNYSSVNLPFALGYSYEESFDQPAGWQFDPTIFGGNQFAGVGFVGVKYLKSPTGPGAIQLFSNTQNGGTFGDPQDAQQLFRYLSGQLQPGLDNPCSTGLGPATHICFVAQSASDTRFFQSSTPLSLAPGEFGSIVVAYILAAPTKVPGFVPGGDEKPGNPLKVATVSSLTSGNVERVDRLTGFQGFTDANGDGVAQQAEFRVAKGSLLDKALVAQSIFNNGFLLPEAPAAPDFFLIPGNNQVTVIWRPTASETAGDAYFNVASQPTIIDPATNSPVANPLFDPNYRQFDVEGYRVWRGRVDSPNELALVAQFDYAGTFMNDFTGQISNGAPNTNCAPELGITAGCPTFPNPITLNGQIIQIPSGGRVPTSTGGSIQRIPDTTTVAPNDSINAFVPAAAVILKADTLITGGASNLPELSDNGVPFSYVDRNVRNGFRYFYAVTAFDVNSITSGPSSLESPKSVTKAVVPQATASNQQASAQVAISMTGRGQTLNPQANYPALDPATGKFAGPMPAANGFTFGLANLAEQVLSSNSGGAFAVTLDSIQLGSSFSGTPTVYWLTGTSSGGQATKFFIPLTQTAGGDPVTAFAYFNAVPVDQTEAGRFGGNQNFSLNARLDMTLEPDYQTTQYGRACVNGADGFTSDDTGLGCEYNGSRWFDGPSPQKNETVDNPNGNNPFNFILGNNSAVVGNYNTAGGLTGVATIHEPIGYVTLSSAWREVQGLFGGAARAADYNVYWGTAGVIDSVIDVTHNVVVPFDTAFAGSWGILTQPASNVPGTFDLRPELTPTDMSCVYPANVDGGVQGRMACTAAAPIKLTNTAVLGPIAEMIANPASAKTAPVRPTPGFLLYMPGHLYMVETAALPAAGSVWSLRTYIGGISGGKGVNGDHGPYTFTPATRTFSAVGATIQGTLSAANQLVATTKTDLEKVHTVPDPYYVTNAYEQATEFKVLKFVNLPQQAIIRIYSSSGVLVKVIEHNSASNGSEENWDLRNRNQQVVASGVYFYHLEAGDARRVGRFTVVNYAQ